jgi:hypothetical protein
MVECSIAMRWQFTKEKTRIWNLFSLFGDGVRRRLCNGALNLQQFWSYLLSLPLKIQLRMSIPFSFSGEVLEDRIHDLGWDVIKLRQKMLKLS